LQPQCCEAYVFIYLAFAIHTVQIALNTRHLTEYRQKFMKKKTGLNERPNNNGNNYNANDKNNYVNKEFKVIF
jgi:hypothetical protein